MLVEVAVIEFPRTTESAARKKGRVEPKRRPNMDGNATFEDEPA